MARLVCVSGENNNKFYNMTQVSADSFEAEWGRVDGNSDNKTYSMSEWDKIYRDKTKSSKKPVPYTDVTELLAAVSESSGKKQDGLSDSRPSSVRSFVESLMSMAKSSVERNYVISAAKVTKAQVEEAQRVLNDVTAALQVGASTQPINDLLIRLYHVIPRKMRQVKDHLLKPDSTVSDDKELREYRDRIIQAEQDALDAMSGQVSMLSVSDSTDTADGDLLERLGLDVRECRTAETEMLKRMLGPNAGQMVRAFAVTNSRTEAEYKEWLDAAVDKKTALLWHGSRNENWWSILQQGLRIRPSNAVLTGAMLGPGVYFADKAKKSMGYTSLSGSYWANGNAKRAVLAVYEIHQGRQLEIRKWNHEHTKLNEEKVKKEGCDSVFAHGGYDLINNEYVIYNSAQSTVRYLVEISG